MQFFQIGFCLYLFVMYRIVLYILNYMINLLFSLPNSCPQSRKRFFLHYSQAVQDKKIYSDVDLMLHSQRLRLVQTEQFF